MISAIIKLEEKDFNNVLHKLNGVFNDIYFDPDNNAIQVRYIPNSISDTAVNKETGYTLGELNALKLLESLRDLANIKIYANRELIPKRMNLINK